MESENQNTGSNKQTKNRNSHRHREQMVARRERHQGDEWNGWKKLVQISSYKINNRDEMYSVTNIVNNSVISLCGNRR